MEKRLPFTPTPQPGESPLGLIRRSAKANRHLSTTRFSYSVDSSFDQSVTGLGSYARSPDRMRRLCDAIGMEADGVEPILYQRAGKARLDRLIWNGVQIDVGDLDIRRAKVCLACCAEQGFAQSEWDHVAAVACARHSTLLFDTCPCCRTPFTHKEEPLSCGCRIVSMEAISTPCTPVAANRLRKQ